MAEIISTNTKTVSLLGARAMVLGKFLDAALPQLTALQCTEVSRSFQQGIEDVLSCIDDVPLPAEYHWALLELTNTILFALDQGSGTRD